MGIKVLVIDDSLLIRQVIKKVVPQSGAQVDEFFEADDGKEGLERIQSDKPDLVLCDINMPEMNGLEMLMHLRQMDAYRELPVIMITTEGSEDTIKEAMELGANGYVLKPFTPEAVAAQLAPLGLIAEPDGQPDADVDLSDPDAF